MIIVQTPLRVSLFGGGTDFASFFREEGGCVLSSAIDKYIFVTIKERFDSKLRIGYTQTEMVDEVDQIHHELIRESLRLTGIERGIEITTMGDIPSEGSGLDPPALSLWVLCMPCMHIGVRLYRPRGWHARHAKSRSTHSRSPLGFRISILLHTAVLVSLNSYPTEKSSRRS